MALTKIPGSLIEASGNLTITDLTVTGDLSITGDLNSYNVTDLDVVDQTITLGAGQTEALSGGSGIIVDGSNASILWDETNTEWDFNNNINVTGTVTADGLTVDGVISIDTSTGAAFSSTGNLKIDIDSDDSQTDRTFQITGDGNSKILFQAEEGGDISFYEDTGTTAKFFWDASEERLGIGTTSPAAKLDIIGEGLIQGRLQVTSSAPEVLFSVPSGGLDSRIHNDGSGNFIFGTGTNSTTPTERMRIDSNGNVGIGATTIDELLHLEKSVNDGVEVKVQNNSTGSSSYAGLHLAGQGNNFRIKNWGDSVAGKTNQTEFVSTAGSSYFVFTNNGSESMRIDSSGNLGIGTDDPLQKLHVNSGTGNSAAIFESTDSTSQIWLKDSASSTTYQTGIACFGDNLLFNNGGERMRIDSNGTVMFKGGTTDNAIQIWENNSEIARIGGSSGTLNFLIGSTTESRMSIDSSGNVGIGTDNPDTLLHLSNNGTTPATIRIERNDTTISDTNIYGGIEFEGQDGSAASAAGIRGKILGVAEGATGEMALTFETAGSYGSSTERMRIDDSGVKLPHDHFYRQEISHHGHNNFPTSYSASSAYTYSDNTDRYAFGPTGEKLVANVTARAFTNYIHLKTNLIANNIMFYIRTKGYFYAYGVEEILMGGYTYNNTQVLNKSFETIAGGSHNTGNNDLYRASSGGNLIIKIQLGHTGYTEGQMVVLFHSHGMDSSVMRDFRIIEVKAQDDGTNPY